MGRDVVSGTGEELLSGLFSVVSRILGPKSLLISLGFSSAQNCSDHRAEITNWARKISVIGGSLRDV